MKEGSGCTPWSKLGFLASDNYNHSGILANCAIAGSSELYSVRICTNCLLGPHKGKDQSVAS